jgi:glycosyltransferase involved in cell wall biosynthesis
MRLGFHSHVPAVMKDEYIFTQGAQGIFIDSLAPYCEKIICFLHSPILEEELQCNYLIKSRNVQLENIGLHVSIPRRMLRMRRYTSSLFTHSGEIDFLLIRGPSPLLPAMSNRIPGIPKALLLVASYKNSLASIRQPWWRKELIRLWCFWNESAQLKVAQKNLTFVNSAMLYKQLRPSLPNLIEIRTTTISEKDIYVREDTCQAAPYHILYSGRIVAEKGLDDILQALALLKNQGICCILDIVGSYNGKVYWDQVLKNIKSLGLNEQVQFHGLKSVGEELLAYYRKADVYIIASRASEGFPRTIWEALSQSTPVIATKVGSIPFYLRHEQDALLAAPNDSEELAGLLKRIFSDSVLRKRLICNGLKLAQNNTLDFRAREMMSHINAWLKNTR